jgi:hypothetical protein
MTTSSDRDDQFRQGYAKSLAEALHERADPPKEDLVHDAYVALCHDDPHVDSDDACRLLANALIKEDSHYRLSERLIEGIRQATGRTFTGGPTSASPKEKEEDNGGELVWLTSGVATAAGYAILSVYVMYCHWGDVRTVVHHTTTTVGTPVGRLLTVRRTQNH